MMFGNLMNFGNNPFSFDSKSVMPAGTSSGAMPSVTELGMQAMQPNYNPAPNAMTGLGQQAMNDTPVFTDSTHKTMYGNTGQESSGLNIDMSGIMNTVKKVLEEDSQPLRPAPLVGGQSTAGGRFDPSQYAPMLAQVPKPLANYANQFQ